MAYVICRKRKWVEHPRSQACLASVRGGSNEHPVYESYDSFNSSRSYHSNLECGSGISGISGEKSHPSSRSYDATGPFFRRNRGKYAPHKICSVKIRGRSSASAYVRLRRDKRSKVIRSARICSLMFGYVRFTGKNFPAGYVEIDSFAPARSALSGLWASPNSFRGLPSGSSRKFEGEN
jgi:hypothetical protein